MTILNYFFIGAAFTFTAEILFDKLKTHPLLKKVTWGNTERITCVIIWPLGMVWFLVAFFKSFFRK